MELPSPLPDPVIEAIAARFRLLGEPTRIRLVDTLRQGEASVGELTRAVGTSQQNASWHLSILYEAGVLGRRRVRNRVCYSIVDQDVLELCDYVCGHLARRSSRLAEHLRKPTD